MRKSASWTRVVPALFLAGALSAGIAAPTAGSCLELPLPERTDRRAVVFIGTVVSVDDERTRLEVEAWYLGEGTSDAVVVFGGTMYPGGERETSVDWTPEQGERYAVVAERSENGTLETEACLQQLVNGRTLSRLSQAYGDPSIPPFAPDPTDRPSATVRPTEAAGPTTAPSAPVGLPRADLIDSLVADPDEEGALGAGVAATVLFLAAAAFMVIVMSMRLSRRPS